MSKNNLQYKYLDAGAKSSPVVLDPNLSTNNEHTIYLYHQQRNQIIEYRRDIVETKLRELNGEEQKVATALQQAYQQARADFTPRGSSEVIPERAPPPQAKPAPLIEDEEGDIDDDDIDLIEDDIDDDELLDSDDED